MLLQFDFAKHSMRGDEYELEEWKQVDAPAAVLIQQHDAHDDDQ